MLAILKYPDPRLREKSNEVTNFDESLQALAAEMRQTMLAAPGAGLAAPQVGHLLRLIVIDGTEEGEEYGQKVITLVNPEIVAGSGEQIYEEGCLSVIDLSAQVTRLNEVKVKAQDLSGKPFVLEAQGRQAVILQHEIDHLNGVLFLDHLNAAKRDMYKRRLKKMKRSEAREG